MAIDNGPTFSSFAMGLMVLSLVALFFGVLHLFQDPTYYAWRNAFVGAFVVVLAGVMVLIFAMFRPAKTGSQSNPV